MEKTKESLFVLFTVPQQQLGSGACYIALDGYPTIMRSKRASFRSYADAKAFAKENRIALNGFTYIGLEDFPDTDLELKDTRAVFDALIVFASIIAIGTMMITGLP